MPLITTKVTNVIKQCFVWWPGLFHSETNSFRVDFGAYLHYSGENTLVRGAVHNSLNVSMTLFIYFLNYILVNLKGNFILQFCRRFGILVS
jgi:hypothetical protein